MSKAPNTENGGPANLQRRPLTFDIDKYRGRLDDTGLTPEQADTYLNDLWRSVISILDLDYEVLFENMCGQVEIDPASVPDARATMLCSKLSTTQKSFENAANSACAPKPDQEAS